MSEYDMVDRLEKQIEGSNLALAAVAEVLQKMDTRLTKAEDDEYEMELDEQDLMEKEEIIKAVAGEVYGLIKADQGMDVSPEPATKASVMGKEMGDKEKAVTIGTKTSEVQHAIQAMQKQLNMIKAGYFENEEGDDEGEWPKPEAEDEDENNGDEGEEGDEEDMGKMGRYSVENGQGYPALEQMQKQISDLTKAFKGQYDIQKMVQGETEGRLRKMGFREETSLQRPMQIRYEDSLGVDGSTPITKGDNPGDVVDQMMNMSYKDLRVLQERIESGETEGIPQEFIG